MNTFVTQVTGDPGTDMGWTPWLVITTNATIAQVTTALLSVEIDVLLDGEQEPGAEAQAAAKVARDSLTAFGITATVVSADYVFSSR